MIWDAKVHLPSFFFTEIHIRRVLYMYKIKGLHLSTNNRKI